MPDLNFQVTGVAAVPFAATPMLVFHIAVASANPEESIYSVALRCQIQIEAARRRYSEEEQERLRDLFGEPERWGQTLRNMLWTNVSATVTPFAGSTSLEMQVPCTFDFNVAATKYFAGIGNGEIPLCFLFSGAVYYAARDGGQQVAPISWNKEARFRLPSQCWRDMMDMYYPNTAWLCLRRDVFERLYEYKVHHGISTWEAALERILPAREEAVKS
jgi:hypothetical protein